MQATFCVKFSSDFRQRHCTHMPSLSPVDFSLFNIPLSFDRCRFVDAAGNVQTIERKQTDDTARIERKISHSLAPEFRINEAWPRFNKPRDYFHPRRGQTFSPEFYSRSSFDRVNYPHVSYPPIFAVELAQQLQLSKRSKRPIYNFLYL